GSTLARNTLARLLAIVACAFAACAAGPTLENSRLRLSFNASTGAISGVFDKATGQAIAIREEGFRVDAAEFSITPGNARLESLRKTSPDRLEATYQAAGRTVVCSYVLGRNHHFFQKSLSLRSPSPFAWKSVVISTMNLGGAKLQLVRYPHQKMVTFFGRSAAGGIFLGVEKPFDSSSIQNQTVTLGYPVSLKVPAGQVLATEPMYFGVYRRAAGEQVRPDLPLESESGAMVALASAILGPPRHGFIPMACGWWSEFEHNTFKDEAAVQADLRSIDFLRQVGVEWVSDSHPWGGETAMMNGLVPTDGYQPGPLVSRFYEYANSHGVKPVFWPTMNNTHPWWKAMGHAFLPGRKDRMHRQ
ncbi:MAG: hypothetical protein NTY38_24925, partial [Acidobacteria bacterium]|nr:hypothetical protein [Acidobacteriota bacterium]